MATGTFTAFYPSRPFWAVNGIDFGDPKTMDNFEELMSEEMYTESGETFSLKICRDGMVMVRIEELEEKDDAAPTATSRIEIIVEKWGEYLDYLNSFYLLLDSSTLRSMNLAHFNLHEITTRDAFRVGHENGRIAYYNIALESVGSTFQMARFRSSYGPTPIAHDPRIATRPTISSEVIWTAAKQFGFVVKNPGLEKVLASIAKSISEYKVGNYETSIILAWFTSETVVSKMWKTHISSLNKDVGKGEQRINRERRDYLYGRDFTIGLVANILELFEVLPFRLFRDIDTVRRLRNKIVHREPEYSLTVADAQLAIKTAVELCRNSCGIDFTPSLSYSVTVL